MHFMATMSVYNSSMSSAGWMEHHTKIISI